MSFIIYTHLGSKSKLVEISLPILSSIYNNYNVTDASHACTGSLRSTHVNREQCYRSPSIRLRVRNVLKHCLS